MPRDFVQVFVQVHNVLVLYVCFQKSSRKANYRREQSHRENLLLHIVNGKVKQPIQSTISI